MNKQKQPNPQGKGGSPRIDAIAEAACALCLPSAEEESAGRLIEDYLASLLVLSCDFRFQPVRGGLYHLYLHRGRMLLSLIAPTEGGKRIFGRYIGECSLSDDFTWSIRWADSTAFRSLSGRSEKISARAVAEDFMRLVGGSPGARRGRYDSKLGYYQNVLNFLLAVAVNRRGRRLLAADSRAFEEVKQYLPL